MPEHEHTESKWLQQLNGRGIKEDSRYKVLSI